MARRTEHRGAAAFELHDGDGGTCVGHQPAEEADRQPGILTLICAAIFLVVKYFEYSHKIHDGHAARRFYSHHGEAR
jgi:hypothetical protein